MGAESLRKSPPKKNGRAATKKELRQPPFETKSLRQELSAFLDKDFDEPFSENLRKVCNTRWGVYAFYDYDDEPIYVGETNESLRTRIRRHLTNQRTDAVAMSVLDPFEVYRIRVWPLTQFEHVVGDKHPERANAMAYLKSLEEFIYRDAVDASKFGAVLNEKIPKPRVRVPVIPPQHYDGIIVSSHVFEIRNHPDSRLARRASTIAKLAQVIAEREVKIGLRNVLCVQADRLQTLARQRFESLGGTPLLERESVSSEDMTEAEAEREDNKDDADE